MLIASPEGQADWNNQERMRGQPYLCDSEISSALRCFTSVNSSKNVSSKSDLYVTSQTANVRPQFKTYLHREVITDGKSVNPYREARQRKCRKEIAPRYEVDVTPMPQGSVGNLPSPKEDETWENTLTCETSPHPERHTAQKRAGDGSNWRLVPKLAYAIVIEAEWSRP